MQSTAKLGQCPQAKYVVLSNSNRTQIDTKVRAKIRCVSGFYISESFRRGRFCREQDPITE